jgi:hypothetical protein
MAKIPWSKIREAFDGEWVELVDCSWLTNSLQPAAGKVRFHNTSRSALLAQIAAAGQAKGSVIIFVGSEIPAVLMHNGALSAAASF